MSSWASYQLQRKRLVTRAEVLKTRVQDFIVFIGPRALIEELDAIGPAQNKMHLITRLTVYRCNHK